MATSPASDPDEQPARLQLEESASFDKHIIHYIQRAAATGLYEIRGLARKRRVPHFDDLVFLGASLSRYPLEGIARSARRRPPWVLALQSGPSSLRCRSQLPDELRRTVGKRKRSPRTGRHRAWHVDHDWRWRHDERGATVIEDARISVPAVALWFQSG